MKLIQLACTFTTALISFSASAALPSAPEAPTVQTKSCAAGETAVAVAQRRQTPSAIHLRLVDANDDKRAMEIRIASPAGPEFDPYQPGAVFCHRLFSPD